MRDIALAASGLLNPKVGGPSVYPPAPEFLFQPPASYGPKTWNDDNGPDRYRRALYTFRFRSVPYPMLQTFDAPNGDVSCVRRVAIEHAAAGADDAQRAAVRRGRAGAGAADAAPKAARPTRDRLALRVPPCAWRASPSRTEADVLLDLLAKQDAALRRGLAERLASWPAESSRTSTLPPDATPPSWPPGPPSRACC